MKLSFFKTFIPLFLLFPTMLQPALALERGYWRGGYWCDVTNNFCGTHPSPYDEYGHQYQYNEPYPTQQPIIRICIAIIGCN